LIPAWTDGTTNPPTTVAGQLGKLISDLAASTGAPKIGAAATPGTPNALASGSVQSQLDALLAHLNDHEIAANGAHPAAAVAYSGGEQIFGGQTAKPTAPSVAQGG
jgi:hypothetical protein